MEAACPRLAAKQSLESLSTSRINSNRNAVLSWRASELGLQRSATNSPSRSDVMNEPYKKLFFV